MNAWSGSLGLVIPGLLTFDSLSLLIGAATLLIVLLLFLCAPATGTLFHYTVMTVFFLGSALVTLMAANLLIFYVAWELTALFAWGIGRLADESAASTATSPFHAAGALASFAMFLGLLFAVASGRSLLMSSLAAAAPTILTGFLLSALFLKTFGLLSESWQAPGRPKVSLASATLAGAAVLVVGLYPFLRFFGDAMRTVAGWREVALPVAGGVALVAALAALGHTDARRVLVYCAFSQFSALVFAFSTGIDRVVIGATIGVYTYALAVTGLALGLDLAESTTRQRTLFRLGGLGQRMPATAVLFLLCVASFAGLPPLGGFVSTSLIGQGLFEQAPEWLLVTWAAAVALQLVALSRLFVRLFLGELRAPVPAAIERRWSVVGSLTVLVVVLVLIGAQPDELLGWTGVMPWLRYQ
ncbi:MAG: hypothetical protein HYY04_15155 [Chloroflexi bacterium]|nr:hypothetical protein [Chloroflexota bacterium]